MGKKIKENTKSCSSEETIDNIQMISKELKKVDETKYKKQKWISMELQGGFKKLKPPMFDGIWRGCEGLVIKY